MHHHLTVTITLLTLLFATTTSTALSNHTDTLSYEFLSKNLGSKSPYHTKYGGGGDGGGGECEPAYLQLVARHGTRNPTQGDQNRFIKLAEFLSSLSEEEVNPEFEWVREWVNPYAVEDAGQLVEAGEREHYELGKRFAERFPSLFPPVYTPSRVKIQTTVVPRASQSGNAFAYASLGQQKGHIGDLSYQPYWSYSQTEALDDTLRFFAICPAYKAEKIDPVPEMLKYREKAFPIIAKNLSSRMGINATLLSDPELLKTIFRACAFEVAQEKEVSQWCSVFTEEDIEAFEFIDDLESYYQKGYGLAINYGIACPLLKELTDNVYGFHKGSADLPNQLVKLNFAHAETIMPLIALLGLHNDAPGVMRWNSTQSVIRNRKWKTSQFSPFAGNIAFLLYRCGSDFQVRVLVNEVEVKLPKCDSVMCPLGQFLEEYGSSKCEFDKLCSLEPSTGADTNGKLMFALYGVTGLCVILLLIVIILFAKLQSAPPASPIEKEGLRHLLSDEEILG
eukprot:TRINITY_DN8879_c0_g1_i1.p1 TRINITY_DN8879_c0_g1~~TRINITY_DN8879_c0_g1_i1.p1  ORF type:complete len:507 (-),score=109.19 TRINITY_DN8879_c0_g1_i1:192-1712(-)